MALRGRSRSVLGLRRMFSNEKEPDVPPVLSSESVNIPPLPSNDSANIPPMPPKDPVDIPVAAICITRHGLVINQQLTFYRKTDQKFLIDDKDYFVPRCMQPPGTTGLDPTNRRFTWISKKEFASNSTAAKQKSFEGAYSVWYKDPGTSPIPRTVAQIKGEFWMMK